MQGAHASDAAIIAVGEDVFDSLETLVDIFEITQALSLLHLGPFYSKKHCPLTIVTRELEGIVNLTNISQSRLLFKTWWEIHDSFPKNEGYPTSFFTIMERCQIKFANLAPFERLCRADRKRLLGLCIRIFDEMSVDQLYNLCAPQEQQTFFQCVIPDNVFTLNADSLAGGHKANNIWKSIKPMVNFLAMGDNVAFFPFAAYVHAHIQPVNLDAPMHLDDLITPVWQRAFQRVTLGSQRKWFENLFSLDSNERSAFWRSYGLTQIEIYWKVSIKTENTLFKQTLPFTDPPRRFCLSPRQIYEREQRRWRTCFFMLALDCPRPVAVTAIHLMPWKTIYDQWSVSF